MLNAEGLRADRIKPIYVSHTEDLSDEDLRLALDVIREVPRLAGVGDRVEVVYNHTFDPTGFEMETKKKYPAKPIDPHSVLDYFRNMPGGSAAYRILVTERKLPDHFAGPNKAHFLAGKAHKGIGAVVSYYGVQFRPESKRALALHETGHIFGAAFMQDGSHCKNDCIMTTRRSSEYPDFCGKCVTDMQDFFRSYKIEEFEELIEGW